MKFFTTPYHQHLLEDQDRLSAFKEALSGNHWGVVYDLGTGSGILSYFVASNADFIFALEKDPKSAQCARENLKEWPNIQVINTDIIDFEFPQNLQVGYFSEFLNLPAPSHYAPPVA